MDELYDMGKIPSMLLKNMHQHKTLPFSNTYNKSGCSIYDGLPSFFAHIYVLFQHSAISPFLIDYYILLCSCTIINLPFF